MTKVIFNITAAVTPVIKQAFDALGTYFSSRAKTIQTIKVIPNAFILTKQNQKPS